VNHFEPIYCDDLKKSNFNFPRTKTFLKLIDILFSKEFSFCSFVLKKNKFIQTSKMVFILESIIIIKSITLSLRVSSSSFIWIMPIIKEFENVKKRSIVTKPNISKQKINKNKQK